jgi:hypothetical protein
MYQWLDEGTTIVGRAAAAYGAMSGITSEEFMQHAGVSLDKLLRDPDRTARQRDGRTKAIALTGAGIEPLT